MLQPTRFAKRPTPVFLLAALILAAPAAQAQLGRWLEETAKHVLKREGRRQVERLLTNAIRCAVGERQCYEKAKGDGEDVVFVDERGEVIVDDDGNPITDPDELPARYRGEAADADAGGASLPWTLEDLQQAFRPGVKITYSRSGTNDEGEEVGGTSVFEVVEATEQQVHIAASWEDPLNQEWGSGPIETDWESAMFLESLSGAEIEVVGSERVEIPAGVFDTVVVELTHDFFGTTDRYWLVPDQPGVYARVVDYGKEEDDQEIVLTLQEVRRP